MNLSDAWRDRLLGGIGSAFAVLYIVTARGIEDSMLADAVGAGGVPQAAGMVLLIASMALLVKSFFVRGAAPSQPQAQAPDDATQGLSRPWLAAAALVLILVVYVLLLPLVGYIIAVSLLGLAVAVLGGARERRTLLLFTAFSGVALWLMFDLALKIRMPVGALFRAL